MSLEFRPLNTVTELMSRIGFEVGYAYDDLAFSENAVFIIQFDKKSDKKFHLFLNKDCETKEATRIEKSLQILADEKGITVDPKGKFELKEKEGKDEFDLVFF